MKILTRSALALALLGATAVCADEATSEETAATTGATYDAATKTLTLDGVLTNITAAADFGEATNIVFRNGGGVSVAADSGVLYSGSRIFSIAGDGLSATGVVEVNSGSSLYVESGKSLLKGAVGHVLVKRGVGTLYVGQVGAAAGASTRILVEEGTFQCNNGDMWGGHSTADTNVVIDVREGATYRHSGHGVVGPIELTGATFKSLDSGTGTWVGPSLDGGVTAHASARDSFLTMPTYGYLGHCNRTNCVINVEDGARLIVEGTLRDGRDRSSTVVTANRLIKRGAGELVLLDEGQWTGGTYLEEGAVSVASANALGAGRIVVAGDVTLKVAAGVTLDLSALETDGAAHALTITGGGAATLPATLPEGLTVDASSARGTTMEDLLADDGTLTLNGGVVTVNVPAGETTTVTAFAEDLAGVGARTDLVKTGAGTLVLPTGSAAAYSKLTVQAGVVSVANESCFGTGNVAVQNGAGLRLTESWDQSRTRLACTGATTLDIPEGVTFGISSNCFVSAGATVTKTGAGTWKMNSPFRADLGLISLTGTRWVVHEGVFVACTGDAFGGHTSTTPLVIEVHEGAVMRTGNADQHLPVCRIVLRGGTLNAYYSQYGKASAPLDGGRPWSGLGLNGPIVALPSLDGRPSRIEARTCHLAHGSATTTFDVRAGATLEIDALLQPGWNLNVTARNDQAGLIKTGGGTLKLLKNVGVGGTFDIRGGTVALGPRVMLRDSLALQVAPAAKLALDDGAQISAGAALAPALCAEAALWFDASRLAAKDGAAVSSVPNYGTAGGAFANATARYNGYTPAAPTFVKDGINGRGCLAFDGSQGLVTSAYTNRGAAVSVFLVSKWTSWAAEGGKGKWGGPFSMMSSAIAQDDNNAEGSLSFQNGSSTSMSAVLSTYGKNLWGNNLSDVMDVGEAYLTHSGRDSGLGKWYTEVWWADDAKAVTNGMSATAVCNIDATCVGGRLNAGRMQISGKDHAGNRMYIGQIGEVLVFSRTLTADEVARVEAYLKAKWFGVAAETKAASPLAVEVAEGATAHLALNASVPGAADATRVDVTKTGAGALVLGGTVEGAARVDVQEGALVFRDGRFPSAADVWVDATDAAGYLCDAEGAVTNLVNKGAAGGAFTRNAFGSSVPFGPTVTAAALNGNAAFTFAGDQALVLTNYVNRTAPRRISIYLAGARTLWEPNPASSNGGGQGKWSGPFACERKDMNADQESPGIVMQSDNTKTKTVIDLGNGGTAEIETPTEGTPYLFVLQSTTNGYMAAFETASKTTLDFSPWSKHEPLDVELVQLGGRMNRGGGAQWSGAGNTGNRMWYGQLGEFIVVTEPLAYNQEVELLAYLRAKWLGKGDGSATPPDWLTGVSATPGLGEATTLAFADGTALDHAAGTVALGGLETAGTVTWQRAWNGADAATFPLFAVTGDVSLEKIVLAPDPVPSAAQVLGFTGAARTAATWKVEGGTGSITVSARADGYDIIPSGTLFFLR